MLRVARPPVGWRHINALLLRQYRGIVPNEIEPLLIPIPGWRLVAQEQVLNRRYSFVMPGDEGHAVRGHSSRNKLLFVAL